MKYCLALDVSKGKSMVIFMSEYGEVLLGPKEYFHNDESLNQLHNEINKVSSHYTVIMESTSVYHKKPESFFKSKNQEVIITNPLLAALSKRTLRRTKTDKLDCEYLANTYFENNFTKQRDDNVIAQLQSQSRLIDSITKNISKTKNIFLMKLTLCFPSLELLFSKKSLYTNGMLEFISKNPHPDYLISKQAKTIRKELSGGKTKGSGSYLNASLKIYKERNKLLPIVEKNSIECHVLSCYAKQLKQLQELYDKEKEIFIEYAKSFWMYDIYHSFAGIGELLSSYFVSELGDVTRFENEKKLIAFCGLDPTIIQSGKSINYKGPISKRGNKYVRKHLYQAILMILRYDGLVKQDSDITTYYKKKRSEGKHHYECVIACSTKLLRKIYYRSKDYKANKL